MSVHVSSLVWRMKLAPTEKLVMLALADIANDERIAYPSNKTLCDRTGLSERAIQGALARIEAAGHLVRDMRTGRSTVYTVLPQTPAADAPPQQMHPRSRCTYGGAADAPPPQQVHP